MILPNIRLFSLYFYTTSFIAILSACQSAQPLTLVPRRPWTHLFELLEVGIARRVNALHLFAQGLLDLGDITTRAFVMHKDDSATFAAKSSSTSCASAPLTAVLEPGVGRGK